MASLEIRCPTCSMRGKIDVSEEEVKSSTRGLFAVNIPGGIVCSHSFIAYIDKNLTVRDTYTADFQIELPAIESKGEDVETSLTDLIDVSIIKLNLTITNLAYIFHAMIYNNKILVVSEQDFLFEKIKEFFNYITKDSYELNIEFTNENSFKKRNYKDYVILKGSEVINDPHKLFNKNKFKGISENHQEIIVLETCTCYFRHYDF